MRESFLAIACLAMTCLGSTAARASDFMDVRLTWSLSDGNLLAGPEDGDPGLGLWSDGARAFFDNYDTRYDGFETLGHLVLYKDFPSFFDDWSGDTALFLGIAPESGLRDESSYIRIRYDWSGGTAEGKTLELTLFPLTADRFRLGYSYRISWGGDGAFLGYSRWVPGARLQLNLPWGYAYAGFKTARITENVGDGEQTEPVTNFAGLFGAGVDWEGFLLEVNGGVFGQGTTSNESVRGEKISTMGLSYQVGYHRGLPVGRSIDFDLYRNDPYQEQHFFAPEEYDGDLSFRVQHEGSLLRQRLEDADNPGQMASQTAWAFDLNAALKWGTWRFHLDAVARSLSHVLLNVPSYTPYQTLSASSEDRAELWAAAGVDVHFPGPRLTPGLIFGVLRPAFLEMDDGSDLPRVVVVYNPDRRSLLPLGAAVHPIYTAKASLRWDFAEPLAFVAELYYSYDDNQVRYTSDLFGLNVLPEWADPNVLGFNLLAQARY